MPKYIIERDIPGVGELTGGELASASRKSCTVLRILGPEIQWVQSFVTPDKLFCVYIAASEDLIRQHATQSGFPASTISKVTRVIDLTTGEEQCEKRAKA
jgi:hypothetical protein